MPYADPAKRSTYLKDWKKRNADKVAVYREKDIPKRKAWDSARYWRNAEKHRQRQREYYAKNRDARVAAQRAYVANNPEKIKAASRVYARDNLPILKARNARRRAIQAGARVGTDRKSYCAFIRSVKSAAHITCYWCGKFVPKRKRHIDHVIPLDKDGIDDVHNLCCACDSCNFRKGSKLPEEFSGQFVIPFHHNTAGTDVS